MSMHASAGAWLAGCWRCLCVTAPAGPSFHTVRLLPLLSCSPSPPGLLFPSRNPSLHRLLPAPAMHSCRDGYPGRPPGRVGGGGDARHEAATGAKEEVRAPAPPPQPLLSTFFPQHLTSYYRLYLFSLPRPSLRCYPRCFLAASHLLSSGPTTVPPAPSSGCLLLPAFPALTSACVKFLQRNRSQSSIKPGSEQESSKEKRVRRS